MYVIYYRLVLCYHLLRAASVLAATTDSSSLYAARTSCCIRVTACALPASTQRQLGFRV